MLNKLLKTSLLLILAMSLTVCTNMSNTPDDETISDSGGTVIGDNGDKVDSNSDLAVLLKDYGRVEADPNNSTLYGYTQLSATNSSLNVSRVDIYTNDTAAWKAGWNMAIPADLSQITKLFYWATSYFDNDDNKNVTSGYIGRVSFDQNGKQISPLVKGSTDTLIEKGKHTEALYPETQLDFNKVTKFFRVLLYHNDKVPGKKGQYFLFPPLYLTHK